MTTLDQIRLLEKKVESAVAKMQQLQAENDALRNKCAELTNALDSKTEQLLSFTTNKEEIEVGIRNALDRLDCIEDTVINTDIPDTKQNGQVPVQPQSIQITPGVGVVTEKQFKQETIVNEPLVNTGLYNKASEIISNNNAMENTAAKPETEAISHNEVSPVQTQETFTENNNNPINQDSITHPEVDASITTVMQPAATVTTEEKLPENNISTEPVVETPVQTQSPSSGNISTLLSGINNGPNFNTMEIAGQQPINPNNVSPVNTNPTIPESVDNTSSKNNNEDEGDQDAFEYDIF